jgi:predicted membrane chloride channel (bestrophin family)
MDSKLSREASEDAGRPKTKGPSAFWQRMKNLWRGPVVDSMTYKADVLTSWSAVFHLQGVNTSFQSHSAWMMVFRLLCLSILVAFIILLTIPNPAMLKTSKFQKIAVFLRVFVGLLLGFFLTSSVNRWFECTKGFLELFDAIRTLQIQLLAMGIPDKVRFKVVRYGVVSGWLLSMMLQIEGLSDDGDKLKALSEMYSSLRDDAEEDPERGMEAASEHPEGDQNGGTSSTSPIARPMKMDEKGGKMGDISQGVANRYTVLSNEEISTLQGVEDPASMMWIWVASLIGRISQDGWCPAMDSPTFGFVMQTVQDAHASIRNVRQSILVQAPFIYVHMLACLVHINNIVNGISFGIVLGSALGTTLQYHKISFLYSALSGDQDVVSDMENLVVSFIISIIGPFLYQVLLEVSVAIAQPFGNTESQIPTERLMTRLQKDLTDAVMMASKPPSWERPRFKKV